MKYNEFGDEEVGVCKRIKYKNRYPKRKKIFGKTKTLYHYTIAYAHKHKKLLNYLNYPKHCISHLCGNAYSKTRKGKTWKTGERSLCINWKHLAIETMKENIKRRNCHRFIRKFYIDFYKHSDVSVKGKLTVDEIKQRLQDENITDYDANILCSHSNNKKCFIYYI